MTSKQLLIDDFVAARPTGEVFLRVFRRGQLVEVFKEENIVVDEYRRVHPRLIGGDTSDYVVSKFGVGTNGTAPVAGNTSLTSQFVKPIDAVGYPAANKVRFDFSLGSAEANGMSIMELGLLTFSGILYARRVRATPLIKTSDVSFSGSWTITF